MSCRWQCDVQRRIMQGERERRRGKERGRGGEHLELLWLTTKMR